MRLVTFMVMDTIVLPGPCCLKKDLLPPHFLDLVSFDPAEVPVLYKNHANLSTWGKLLESTEGWITYHFEGLTVTFEGSCAFLLAYYLGVPILTVFFEER